MRVWHYSDYCFMLKSFVNTKRPKPIRYVDSTCNWLQRFYRRLRLRALDCEGWEVVGVDNINLYKPQQWKMFMRHFEIRQTNAA